MCQIYTQTPTWLLLVWLAVLTSSMITGSQVQQHSLGTGTSSWLFGWPEEDAKAFCSSIVQKVVFSYFGIGSHEFSSTTNFQLISPQAAETDVRVPSLYSKICQRNC